MVQQKKVTYQNCNIHYSMYGSGKAVLLIHGFGEDSTIWNAQVDYLQDKYLLIVPDIPGSRKSDPLQPENVRMLDYALAIKAILDNENIGACCMLGHSMGGYIALAFAALFPNLLKGLGLVHSSAYADDLVKIAVRKKGIQFIREHGSAAFLTTSIPNLFHDTTKSKEDIATLIEKGESFLPEVLIQYYNAMITRPDSTDVLRDCSCPVLFIIGEFDLAVPFVQSMPQTHLPAISYIHIMRHSAHMSMLEETAKCNNILGEFLQIV